MRDLKTVLKKAEQNLNTAFRHYEEAPHALAKEFVELKLQACIFQYDVSAEMVGVVANQPEGFACSVALKGLVLRIYEYDQVLSGSLMPRLMALAEKRGMSVNTGDMRALRKEWKHELSQLKAWHEVRNHAAGHYGTDLNKQVSLLQSLSIDGVISVARGFLSFNGSFMCLLAEVGRGVR